jgi:alpha-1,2-mannosyltransferase
MRPVVHRVFTHRRIAVVAAGSSLALAVGYLGALYFFLIRGRQSSLDFSTYYLWSFALLHNINPYRWNALVLLRKSLGVGGMHCNYPPPFLLLIRPLARLDLTTAFHVWSALDFMLLALGALMLTARTELKRYRLVVLAGILLYGPVTDNLYWGQVQMLLLVLLLMLFRDERGDGGALGSVALGVATLVKIYPAVLLGHFLLTRRWRFVAQTLSVVLAGEVLGLYVFGPGANLDFVRECVSSVTGSSVGSPLNISFVTLVWRAGHFVSFLRTRLALSILTLPIAILLLVACGMATRVAHARGESSRALGAWVAASVLVAPISWFHHMVLLLLPLTDVAAEPWRSSVARKLAIASYGLAELAMMLLWLFSYRAAPFHIPSLSTAIGASALASAIVCFAAAYCWAIAWPPEPTAPCSAVSPSPLRHGAEPGPAPSAPSATARSDGATK